MLPLLMRLSVAMGLPGAPSSAWQHAALPGGEEPLGPRQKPPPQLMRFISAAIDCDNHCAL